MSKDVSEDTSSKGLVDGSEGGLVDVAGKGLLDVWNAVIVLQIEFATPAYAWAIGYVGMMVRKRTYKCAVHSPP